MNRCECKSCEVCECIHKRTDRDLWAEICQEFDKRREEIQEFTLQKNENRDVPPNPEIYYLNSDVFPLLYDAIIDTLYKAEENDSLVVYKTAFNGLDHIAEYLWNKNRQHPERLENYIYIHDMDWVQEFLGANPRPYYPTHLLWSDDYAALKIQSFLRGYWVRKRDDVQEVRCFWKQLKLEGKKSGTSLSRRFYDD